MPIITDPVGLGLVASLVRPGGNATGFATQNDELPGKWMELIDGPHRQMRTKSFAWSPSRRSHLVREVLLTEESLAGP